MHEGVVHELTGFEGPAFFQGLPYPERPHYSVFSFEHCDKVFRDEATFASHTEPIDTSQVGMFNSILTMGGSEHRRYRTLVQPSFVPAKARWWIQNWIEETVEGLIDGFEADGKAELNVDFDAAIPVLTITGSFGLSVDDALDIRAALGGGGGNGKSIPDYLAPVIAARREHPEDDLISVLCQASVADEDGTTHRLTDAEILSFSLLLLAAGSGTTWKQLGITLVALLTRPDVLSAVRDDRELLRAAIEESVRWSPTDPMFSRFATCDTEIAGVGDPRGRGGAPLPRRGEPRPVAVGPPRRVRRLSNARVHPRVRGWSTHLPGHARGAGGDLHRGQRAARPAAEPAPRSRRRAAADHRDVRTWPVRDQRPLGLSARR